MQLNESEFYALRELQREVHQLELDDSKGSLDFIRGDSGIPLDALTGGDLDEHHGDPFSMINGWMLREVTDTAAASFSFSDVLDLVKEKELGVSPLYARKLFETLQSNEGQSYRPGVQMIGRILAVIPLVASREGITDRDEWTDMADKARRIGKKLVGPNTGLQLTFVNSQIDRSREHRIGNFERFDHRNFVLDEKTGITTITPIDEMTEYILAARRAARLEDSERETVCPAITTSGVVERTLYDDHWSSYVDFVGEHIYPGFILPENLEPAFKPDSDAMKAEVDGSIARQIEDMYWM